MFCKLGIPVTIPQPPRSPEPIWIHNPLVSFRDPELPSGSEPVRPALPSVAVMTGGIDPPSPSMMPMMLTRTRSSHCPRSSPPRPSPAMSVQFRSVGPRTPRDPSPDEVVAESCEAAASAVAAAAAQGGPAGDDTESDRASFESCRSLQTDSQPSPGHLGHKGRRTHPSALKANISASKAQWAKAKGSIRKGIKKTQNVFKKSSTIPFHPPA